MLASNLNKQIFIEREKTLIGYFLAGYPSIETFLELMRMCDSANIDILEIGIPSSTPYADGKIIRNAHKLMVDKDIDILKLLKKIRKRTNKPIWIMAYYDEFIKNKEYKKYVSENVVDAFVIPDMEFEERVAFRKNMEAYGIDVLGFTDPSMTSKEMCLCFEEFCIVYQQLYSGITGEKNTLDQYEEMLELSKKYPDLINVAGFGISTKEMAKDLLNKGYNGIIIGTEMVKRLNKSTDSVIEFIEEVGNKINNEGGTYGINSNL